MRKTGYGEGAVMTVAPERCIKSFVQTVGMRVKFHSIPQKAALYTTGNVGRNAVHREDGKSSGPKLLEFIEFLRMSVN